MKIQITKKDKTLNQKQFLGLLEDFIDDSYSGLRLKKNGTKVGSGSIKNYECLQKIILGFTEQSTFELKVYLVNNLTQKQHEQAKRFYVKFYKALTNYMYKKLDFYDNYVGNMIKTLKTFFNYLNSDRCLHVGTYHKLFYVPTEEIPIIALTREQLNYIINNKEFIKQVQAQDLEKVRDIFIFGCTVALRVSDLLTLRVNNLIIRNGCYYLIVKSQKTKTHTSIKLPPYCVEILKKYKSKQKTLLPGNSAAWFNTKLKRLAKLLPDDFELIKTRDKNGKPYIIYKDKEKKVHYKLSDHISTHTMRRTAITTMLNLGMPEYMVRKISGHAPNSKEFFKYVQLSQSFMDDETDKVFEKLVQN